MSELERLAKAIMEGRVWLNAIEEYYLPDRAPDYRIVVDPDPEEEAIASIKKGKP